jgi:uncharacterized protein
VISDAHMVYVQQDVNTLNATRIPHYRRDTNRHVALRSTRGCALCRNRFYDTETAGAREQPGVVGVRGHGRVRQRLEHWQNCNYIYAMTIRFAWDETKNRSNQRKHDGIAFEMAVQVFRDPFRLTRHDRIEDGEERWQTLGVVHGVTVLLVAHTITEDDAEGEAGEVIRIISARRATPRERKRYEQETR